MTHHLKKNDKETKIQEGRALATNKGEKVVPKLKSENKEEKGLIKQYMHQNKGRKYKHNRRETLPILKNK